MLKVLDCGKKINYISRSINMCRMLRKEDDSTPKRKVKETVELVMLVDQNDKILGLKPKLETEKLARKLNLTLERVHDAKYGKMHPAYKMFSPTDLFKAENKASTAKVLKKLPLNSRISDNDLAQKLNIIRKWLAKNCEVHIAILKNNEQESTMKNVLTKIEEQLKSDCRILNIRHNEASIKFIVLPPKQPSNKNPSKSKKETEQSTEDS